MITKFNLIDHGVVDLHEFLEHFGDLEGFQFGANGVGTDAEGALDDLLEYLANAYDVTGLEGRIKSRWEPSREEGDCDITYYCIRLRFDED